MYAGWYGLGRFFIEGLRTDSLMVGNLRVSQVLAAICVIASVALLIVLGQKVKNMGDDYVLYCNTDESKKILLEAEEKLKKAKKEPETDYKPIAEETESLDDEDTDDENLDTEKTDEEIDVEEDKDNG